MARLASNVPSIRLAASSQDHLYQLFHTPSGSSGNSPALLPLSLPAHTVTSMAREKAKAEPPKGSPAWRAMKLANAASDRYTQKTWVAPRRAVYHAKSRANSRRLADRTPTPGPPTPRDRLLKSAEVLTGTVTPDTAAAASALAAYSSSTITTSIISRSSFLSTSQTPPPSVSNLTGIPVTGHDYGRPTRVVTEVLRRDRPVETTPIRFTKYCMKNRRKEADRNPRACCLRCASRRLRCSLEWPDRGCSGGGRGSVRCTRCQRNGCEYCVRVLPGDLGKALDDPGGEGGVAGFTYVTVPGPTRRDDVVIYVCDAEAPDPETLRDVAMELLQGTGPNMFGVPLNPGEREGLVLPRWQQQVMEWREAKAARDAAWLSECERTGLAHLLPETEEADESVFEEPTWHEYFERKREESAIAGPERDRRMDMWETWGILM